MAHFESPKLSATEWRSCAKVLDQALLEGRETERLTVRHPNLNAADAYRVQEEGIALRLERKERVIGFKMGLTSRAKREQMNLDSPVYGVLTDRMKVEGTFHLAGTIHPKIEPEIAFILGRELKGQVNAEEAWAACSGVAPAMEILDSRYVGFKYFSLPDVIADNSSSAWFVLGSPRTPTEIGMQQLAELQMRMEVDGKLAQQAAAKEISGNPIQSLVQLCDLLSARGQSVPAGSVVLAGAATLAVALVPGQFIKLSVEKLGNAELKIA